MTTEFTDLNARKVHAFASQMANLGFERMTEELLAMLDSEAWHEFKDGLGTYRFLPGTTVRVCYLPSWRWCVSRGTGLTEGDDHLTIMVCENSEQRGGRRGHRR